MHAAVVVPLLAFVVAGCSASTEEQAATETAVRFAASAQADPQAACVDLAPVTLKELERNAGQACAAALKDEDLPASSEVLRTALAGSAAMVELDEQTVFLARFDSGWKVIAAGCARDSNDDATPYDCPVKGN